MLGNIRMVQTGIRLDAEVWQVYSFFVCICVLLAAGFSLNAQRLLILTTCDNKWDTQHETHHEQP
jgi:hypothetical protein